MLSFIIQLILLIQMVMFSHLNNVRLISVQPNICFSLYLITLVTKALKY